MARLAICGGQPVRSKPYPRWPIYGQEELEALKEVLESGVWGIGGQKQLAFAERFARYHGVRFGVAVTNGTVGLEVALRALGVGCGDEVVVPAYTFMATPLAVLYVNAIPIFADIDPETYTLSPESLQESLSEKTKAVIPVHIAGQPCNMDAILKLAEEHGLRVIEDACQAWGAEWRGRRVGSLGDVGAFSFQSSKNITAGEGGIVVTDSEELYRLLWAYHNCGRSLEGETYTHHLPGGNYRMTEFQAAILLVQLDRYDQQLQTREENAQHLDHLLTKIDGVRPLKRPPEVTRHAHHLYIFRYDPEAFGGLSRERFVEALNAEGIPAYLGYRPLYQEPFLQAHRWCHHKPRQDYIALHLPHTEQACYEAVWLHQSVLLAGREDMEDIAEAIAKIQLHHEELL
jgi:dTDP-4-amino-4,6-dideoxygalactose transaminase